MGGVDWGSLVMVAMVVVALTQGYRLTWLGGDALEREDR
jgi:hypothetical protein